jgi:hypothetical protein
VTEDELASEPGTVATRTEGEAGDDAAEAASAPATEPVFKPRDFRLNLQARLAEPAEPLTDLDSPAIRKLTWEHVVPDRPASSAPSAATIVPLPPPSRVVPPAPPRPAKPLEPPVAEATLVSVDDEDDAELVDDEIDDAFDETVDSEVGVDEVDVDEVDVDAVDVDAVAWVPAAEVNRLASVPDLIDDDSPVELPLITPSGPIVAHPQSVYTPVLAETLYVPMPARQPTTTAAAMVAESKPPRRRAGRKPKRHLFRSFVTLVLLFGLLAGGAFAAKKYLLQQPEWSAELKPLADEVAAARALQFKVAVEVSELPVGDYAARLAGSTPDVQSGHAPAWRSLGLINGEFDLESIGRQAMNDSPAFYDPASKTIYVSDDLVTYEHLYRFAMRRALTAALLDQQFDWSTRVAASTPAAALALRAVIDADALAIANVLSTNDAPDQLAPETLSFAQGHGTTPVLSPYAATIVGRPGVAMRPTTAVMVSDPATLNALEQATPLNDTAFDLAHVDGAPATTPGTQGMIFWYYVLASRIDDGQAWAAATRWTSDSVATSTGSASQCIDAKVTAADPDGAAVLLAAFESWAASAPAESTTTVVLIDGNQVAVRACDPGAVLTAQLPMKSPVAFGGAGVERALVQAAVSAAGQATVDSACLVNAARQRALGLTSPTDDAPVLAFGWAPPYVAGNLDLAIACMAPPAD